jgi:hypothetical protein
MSRKRPSAPITPEEIARRKAICLACSDWEGDGCGLIAEYERARLSAYKQEHGHCARGCRQGKRKW